MALGNVIENRHRSSRESRSRACAILPDDRRQRVKRLLPQRQRELLVPWTDLLGRCGGSPIFEIPLVTREELSPEQSALAARRRRFHLSSPPPFWREKRRLCQLAGCFHATNCRAPSVRRTLSSASSAP